MKKIPMRMCVITREKLPKNELLRVVENNGSLMVDLTGKVNGHGVYVKKDKLVIEDAKNKNLLKRFFENVDNKIYDDLLDQIK